MTLSIGNSFSSRAVIKETLDAASQAVSLTFVWKPLQEMLFPPYSPAPNSNFTMPPTVVLRLLQSLTCWRRTVGGFVDDGAGEIDAAERAVSVDVEQLAVEEPTRDQPEARAVLDPEGTRRAVRIEVDLFGVVGEGPSQQPDAVVRRLPGSAHGDGVVGEGHVGRRPGGAGVGGESASDVVGSRRPPQGEGLVGGVRPEGEASGARGVGHGVDVGRGRTGTGVHLRRDLVAQVLPAS